MPVAPLWALYSGDESLHRWKLGFRQISLRHGARA